MLKTQKLINSKKKQEIIIIIIIIIKEITRVKKREANCEREGKDKVWNDGKKKSQKSGEGLEEE